MGSDLLPKDTFDGFSHDKTLCGVDNNEGRAQDRTGAHVESEVVLKCDGNNNEGVCDMLCLCENDCFVGHKDSC